MNAVTRADSLRANPKKIDPDVKIPEAVRKAAEAATAAQAAAYPGQTPEPPLSPPAPGNDTIVISEPSAPEPVTPQGNPSPAPEPQPAPAPMLPTEQPVDQSWEHKFNSERGRHAKTQDQLRQAVDRLSALEVMVQELKAAPPTPTPAPAAPSRLITPEEEEQFGGEMIDVMGRRAKEIVSPELSELRSQMQLLEQKLNGTTVTVSRNARADMHTKLDGAMPLWREINNRDDFKAWLALPDAYSGAIRHGMLLQAYEQNDTPRVLNFFKGFVSELAATTPADEPELNPSPAKPAKPALESLAAPGRARTPAQQQAPDEKQIITTADVAAFYAAKRRGAYNGREDEFNALEQELFKAQREGRVRPA